MSSWPQKEPFSIRPISQHVGAPCATASWTLVVDKKEPLSGFPIVAEIRLHLRILLPIPNELIPPCPKPTVISLAVRGGGGCSWLTSLHYLAVPLPRCWQGVFIWLPAAGSRAGCRIIAYEQQSKAKCKQTERIGKAHDHNLFSKIGWDEAADVVCKAAMQPPLICGRLPLKNFLFDPISICNLHCPLLSFIRLRLGLNLVTLLRLLLFLCDMNQLMAKEQKKQRGDTMIMWDDP